jgi:RNA polymerase sigma-70 factor (ECF subfamily)
MEFADLVREHQAMVFSIACHFLHDRALAEEVAQEVFLQLHRHLDSLESPAHVLHWLRRSTCNRCIDSTRHRRFEPQVGLESVPEPAASSVPGDPLLARRLRQLVASLPPKQRAVVIMRYQEDLEPEEIAGLLEMPVGTVKSQLQRSLAILREKVKRTMGLVSL